MNFEKLIHRINDSEPFSFQQIMQTVLRRQPYENNESRRPVHVRREGTKILGLHQ